MCRQSEEAVFRLFGLWFHCRSHFRSSDRLWSQRRLFPITLIVVAVFFRTGGLIAAPAHESAARRSAIRMGPVRTTRRTDARDFKWLQLL